VARASRAMHLMRRLQWRVDPGLRSTSRPSGVPKRGRLPGESPSASPALEFGNEAAMTISEVFLGGRSFMPPGGQCSGNPADILSDQYALGVDQRTTSSRASRPTTWRARLHTAKVKGLLMGSVNAAQPASAGDLPNRWEAAHPAHVLQASRAALPQRGRLPRRRSARPVGRGVERKAPGTPCPATKRPCPGRLENVKIR